MRDIKTKSNNRAPHVMSDAVRAPKELARSSVVQAKEQTQDAAERREQPDEAPDKYAASRIERSAKEMSERTVVKAKQGGNKLIKKVNGIRKQTKQSGGTKSRSSFSSWNSTAESAGRERTVRQAGQARKASRNMQNTVRTAKGATKTTSRTVKTAKKTAKTAKVTVKTAQRTAKTAKRAVQTAAKAAKAAAKAAQAAARAAVKAAKIAVKVIIAIIKAIIAAIKALIAAIAAGGWIAVVIILVVAIVALILGSVFGIFGSNDTEGLKMSDVVTEINADYRGSIDAKIAELSAGDYDEVKIEYEGDMDGDSESINNWTDVLGIYAVKATTDEDDPVDVITITEEKKALLRDIFYAMNRTSYRTEVKTERIDRDEDSEQPSPSGEKKTLIIHITVVSQDYESAAAERSFDENQMQLLTELMSPAYYSMFAELIGVDVYGGENMTDILRDLPVGAMGSEVIQVAATKVGAPYVLGAKGPSKFDCSGLVYWCINELDPALGRNLYTSAGYQYKYCKDNGFLVNQDTAVAGDLVFWQKPNCHCGAKYNEIHHVGFYLGDGMILDASSSNGRVIIRKLWSGGSYIVYAFARPYGGR